VTLAVVLVLVLGLALGLVIAVARDPGATPTDVAIGYAVARANGDFDALYRMTSDAVLHGQNRAVWIAEHESAPREVRDPAGIEVLSTEVVGDHARVELRWAPGTDRASVDLVFRQRAWLVELFATSDFTS